MTPHPLWKDQRPGPAAWKPAPELSRRERGEEQDRAAGGHAARQMRLPNGRTVHASVALRVFPSGRRIYAYLRWSDRGRTRERYVGEVDGPTREENLRQAWRQIHTSELLSQRDQPTRPRHNNTRETNSWASTPNSRAVMRANRGRDTRPERALRSAVHALGLRYRVATRPIKDIRRTADLVFPRAKVAVFLDGCFWHGCPQHHRPATGATANFWRTKIEANKRRDTDTDQRLHNAGWEVVRIWEHDDLEEAAHRVAAAVRDQPQGPR
ncbi:DNA mismatch endonuclease Vsr [Saccharomonospora marina XMU15]|uniref:DNA mismatch endonuclease Vsr n=1 Tax=Saccharomonospora marina XMU15 TaxID=882083 RepID=H5X382_9PSEU|nr:very short patch repair endonuclease [Saccharomonospora marina]EHR48751.1 DNA mismatch endonuclease Vsr [Saccharomonospora marina XMU15]